MTNRQTTTERVQYRRERNQSIVSAKVQENFQAGIGVASVIVGGVICWYVFSERDAIQQPFWIVGVAIGAGAIWFGVLSVIRFSLDEVRDLAQWLRLQEVAAGYLMQVEQLKADNAELRRENRRLQSSVKTQEFNQVTKNAREVVQAADKYEVLRRNVDDILQRWGKGLKYGRDDVTMTRAEWEAAIKLLDSAGLLGADDKNPRKRIIIAESLTQAQKRVDAKLRVWEQFDTTNFTPA